MTIVEMMELWRREFEREYNQWKLTRHVYDYLEGITDELVGSGVTSKRYYLHYPDWLVKELDGENSELARRMLRVISRVRNCGLISGPYRMREEASICLRIGYDLDTIVKHTVICYSDISAGDIYYIAELIVAYYPNEAESYAEQTLRGNMQNLTKDDHEMFLALYLEIALLNKDAVFYSYYLYRLIAASQCVGGGLFLVTMLYHSYRLAPALKDALLVQLESWTTAEVLYEVLEKKDVRPFLQEIGASFRLYYYLTANGTIPRADRVVALNDLYKDDRHLFIETFSYLATTSQDLPYSLYLLSVLLRNGEGQAELEQVGKILTLVMIRLVNEYDRRKGWISEANLLNDSFNWQRCLDCMRCFGKGEAEVLISALGLFYDSSSLARRYIDMLLLQANGLDSRNNASLVVFYVLEARKRWLHAMPADSLRLLLDSNNSFGAAQAFRAYCNAPVGMSETLTPEYVEQNKQAALNLLNNGSLSIKETQEWLSLIYVTCRLREYEPLIGLLSNNSKILRRKAEEIISLYEAEIHPVLAKRLSTLRGQASVLAKRLIKNWNSERTFGTNFVFTQATVNSYCTANFDKDSRRHLSWIPEERYLDIRFADLSEKAPAVVLPYLLSEYLSLNEPCRIKACDQLVSLLYPPDLQAALEHIYMYWKENGSDPQKKRLLIPYCIYVSDTQVLKLRNQMDDWVNTSRCAMAVFAVNAIALNGGRVALMMVDHLSVAFPNNQVMNAAKAAFTFAAGALGIPEDELLDKIVPTLECDAELPEQKQLIRTVLQTQISRLKKVLMNGRRWTVEAWRALFAENPVMRSLAIGLIWGVYDGNVLTVTLRYTNDGTFRTIDDDVYMLSAGAAITLVHPIELSAAILSRWKKQLDDFGVVQPLMQLAAPVVTLANKESADKRILCYSGAVSLSGRIVDLAKEYNLMRGPIWDGGIYTSFNRVDNYLNVVGQLNFAPMYMRQDYYDPVILGDVLFYRLGEDQDANDEPTDAMILDPADVSPRFISSVLDIFDQSCLVWQKLSETNTSSEKADQ